MTAPDPHSIPELHQGYRDDARAVRLIDRVTVGLWLVNAFFAGMLAMGIVS